MTEGNQLAKLLAITLKNGGVTFDYRTRVVVPPRDAWYFPKYPELTVIEPRQQALEALARFCYEHEARLSEDRCFLGLWRHPDTDKIYIDITTYRESCPEAIIDASAVSERSGREVVSLHNPVREKTVYRNQPGP